MHATIQPVTGFAQFFAKTYRESPEPFMNMLQKLFDRTLEHVDNPDEYEVVVSWELKRRNV